MKKLSLIMFLISLAFSDLLIAQNFGIVKEVTLVADTAKVEVQTISMVRTDLVSKIKPDQWYYIAITKSSDLEAKLYINGVLIATGTWENKSYVYNSLHLGASFYTSWGNFFKGYLDEFRMSNVVRTDNEIRDYYNSNQEFAVDGNTIGLWHFNEESGTSISNAVPSSASGSLFNGVEFVNGKFNNCLYFNGIDSRGDCNLNIPEYNITFEFWFKYSEPQYSVIISAYGMNNSHVHLNYSETIPNILWSTGDTTASITVNPDTLDFVWVSNGSRNDTVFFNSQLAIKYDTITTEVFDTTFITVYDSISVTDTLIIDAVLTDIIPPDNRNTLKIYPNPSKEYIIINTGTYADMQNYRIKIVNMAGATVFETQIEEPEYQINLSNWTGKGTYFVKIFNSTSQEISVKKIILQ